ncbi:MAG: glycosyltransferase family 39 protein [Aggregatilineales bacterium]
MINIQGRKRLAEIVALLIVLGVAAWLRLSSPEVVEFKRDEANLARLALDFAHGREFPLLGISSSVGLRNAPFSVYVVMPPFLLTSDPIFATQYIGVLNVLAVGLLYGLGKRYYGTTAALIAAACLATSPWAVIFSRKLWAQNALMPFIILTVGSGIAAFLAGSRREQRLAQLLHLPLLSVTIQIHFAAVALVPLSLYLIGQGRRRLTRYFVAGLFLAALSVVPYAIGALEALHNSTWASAQLSTRAGDGLLGSQALEYALIVLSGADLHSLAGPEMFTQWLESVPTWAYALLYIFGGLCLVCGLWRLLIGLHARRTLEVALGLWLLVPLAIFSIRWVAPQLHYLIPLMPAGFLALGAWLSDVIKKRQLTVVMLGALFGVVTLQAALLMHLLSFVGQVATPGGFGTPLGMYMPIRAELLAQQPADLLIRLDGQFVGIDDEATVWDALLYDLPNRRFVPPQLDVFPEGDALVLSGDCSERIGTPYAMRPLADGTSERCFALSVRRPTDFDPQGYTALLQAGRLSIGGGLEAFAWDDAQRCLQLVWRLPEPVSTPLGDQFHVALSLYGQDQTRLAQADGQFWLGRFWRANDRVVSRHCLPELPAEPAFAQIGLYTYRQGAEGLQFFNLQWLQDESEAAFYRLSLESARGE